MRIRTVKPAFFVNDDLAGCEPLARLLFIGLWCAADCEGRLEDRPRRLKAELLPYDDTDVDALLKQLAAGGFIHRYEANGRRCIQVVNFTKHQRITGKEAEAVSELPPPPPEPPSGSSGETRPVLPERTGEAPGKQRGNTGETSGTTGREGKGKEWKGVGGSVGTERAARASSTPAGRFVTPSLEEVRLAAAKLGLPDREALKFHAHFMANGWRVGGRTPMKSFQHALIKWKCTWEERAHEAHRPTERGRPGENPRNAAMGADAARRGQEIRELLDAAARRWDADHPPDANQGPDRAREPEPQPPHQ